MRILSILALLAFVSAAGFAAPRTMRVDYYHTGNAGQEIFSLDSVTIEPLEWAGNPAKPIDDSNLGKYLFEVRDAKSNNLLYSRGFSSIYGEWETTDEAKSQNRTFSESFRFPTPDGPVKIVLKKRDKANAFVDIWTLQVDPKDMFVDRSVPKAPGKVIPIEKNGDPSNKVDFLILGDGYTEAEMAKFERDARRLTEILFSTSPYKERRKDFNVWALCPPAAESGISRPSTAVYRDSPVGATYDAFGSERYVLTFDNKDFRRIASFAPYDFVEILVNNHTYGGGGIFNLYATVAADSDWSPYVFVHEFGHHFAGLADEYYTSAVSYGPATEREEPWEPNATALLDPSNLKWKDLVTPGTPIPTPWNKDEFEKYSLAVQKRRREIRAQNRPEAEMNALFREELEHEKPMFAKDKYAGKVGAFEGAIYEAKGYYRPVIDCIMFTRTSEICRVCSRGISRVIDMYSRN